MSLKKLYVKKTAKCKVTIRLPKKESNGAKSVHIVGDFNNWNSKATPMKSLKKGDFTATLDLDPNREYQFRYLLNNKEWHNDDNADRYIFNQYGNCDNSVIRT